MKHLIKHGNSVPTAEDLDEYQLGWCDSEKKLYIKNGNNEIIPIENDVTGSHVFFEVYQVNEHKTVENSLNLFKLSSKEFTIYSDNEKKKAVGTFSICAAKVGNNSDNNSYNVYLYFTPLIDDATVLVSAYSSFLYNGTSVSDIGEGITLSKDSFAVQLLSQSISSSFTTEILLKLDTTNINVTIQTDISKSYAIVKGETTYGGI